MRRRSFLHTMLLGAGFASGELLQARTRGIPADAPPQSSANRSRARRHEPIIDVHMHAYPPGEAIPALANPATERPVKLQDGEAHLRACLAEMTRLNIVTAVVSGGTGDRLAAAEHWQESAPDRFIAAAGVRGSADTPLPEIGVLRKAFEERRLRVLGEVTAEYAGLTLSDPIYRPYLALAEELDIPVALHTGLGGPGISYDPCCRGFRASLGNPALIEEALNRHPKLRVSLMHGGWPYLQETIATLATYPQVNTDLGSIDWLIPRAEFHAYLQSLIRAGFGKRMMFGSDQMYWPEAIGMAVDAVDSATFLTHAERRDIFYGNAARFFRLGTGD